jgi:hypothetical protein
MLCGLPQDNTGHPRCAGSAIMRRIFQDGSARDLLAVVNHYDRQFNLNLTRAQKVDLVEFLKSL